MRLRSHPSWEFYCESVDLKNRRGASCQNLYVLNIQKSVPKWDWFLPQLFSSLIFFTLVMTPLVHLHCAQDREGQHGQGWRLVLCTLRPQTPRGGLASLCLRAFFFIIPTSVSSLCKSSSPSPPCICFIAFCLRSPMKESLPPRVRGAAADIRRHPAQFAQWKDFLSWSWIYIRSTSSIKYQHTFHFPLWDCSSNTRRSVETLLWPWWFGPLSFETISPHGCVS